MLDLFLNALEGPSSGGAQIVFDVSCLERDGHACEPRHCRYCPTQTMMLKGEGSSRGAGRTC